MGCRIASWSSCNSSLVPTSPSVRSCCFGVCSLHILEKSPWLVTETGHLCQLRLHFHLLVFSEQGSSSPTVLLSGLFAKGLALSVPSLLALSPRARGMCSAVLLRFRGLAVLASHIPVDHPPVRDTPPLPTDPLSSLHPRPRPYSCSDRQLPTGPREGRPRGRRDQSPGSPAAHAAASLLGPGPPLAGLSPPSHTSFSPFLNSADAPLRGPAVPAGTCLPSCRRGVLQ